MARKMKVFSSFTGIGFTEKGLEMAGYDLDVVGTSETDTDAIISYMAIHHNITMEDVENYSEYPSREEMAQYLIDLNIGYDWDKNKPYDWMKIARGKDGKMLLQRAWLACKLNKNYGDICKIESIPKCDLFTYTSPCQSYSIAGRQDGNKITCEDCGFEFNPFDYDVKDRYECPHCHSANITSTRSGLMAEVERLILTSVRKGEAPTFLLQENVDALVSKKFIDDFENWIGRLDRLGYNTYWQCINTKFCSHPGCPTPQNRNRLFSISILKEKDNGKFEFPKKFDAGIRLKDILLDEDDVPENMYINSEKAQTLIDELILNGTLTEDEDE